MELAQIETIRCPTCKAGQPSADVCRRCKSDLRLLRAAEAAYRASRGRCLQSLRAGALEDALRHARYCLFLREDDDSRRLAGLCALYAADWPTALALARKTLDHAEGNRVV
jgi:hypothetical protein